MPQGLPCRGEQRESPGLWPVALHQPEGCLGASPLAVEEAGDETQPGSPWELSNTARLSSPVAAGIDGPKPSGFDSGRVSCHGSVGHEFRARGPFPCGWSHAQGQSKGVGQLMLYRGGIQFQTP